MDAETVTPVLCVRWLAPQEIAERINEATKGNGRTSLVLNELLVDFNLVSDASDYADGCDCVRQLRDGVLANLEDTTTTLSNELDQVKSNNVGNETTKMEKKEVVGGGGDDVDDDDKELAQLERQVQLARMERKLLVLQNANNAQEAEICARNTLTKYPGGFDVSRSLGWTRGEEDKRTPDPTKWTSWLSECGRAVGLLYNINSNTGLPISPLTGLSTEDVESLQLKNSKRSIARLNELVDPGLPDCICSDEYDDAAVAKKRKSTHTKGDTTTAEELLDAVLLYNEAVSSVIERVSHFRRLLQISSQVAKEYDSKIASWFEGNGMAEVEVEIVLKFVENRLRAMRNRRPFDEEKLDYPGRTSCIKLCFHSNKDCPLRHLNYISLRRGSVVVASSSVGLPSDNTQMDELALASPLCSMVSVTTLSTEEETHSMKTLIRHYAMLGIPADDSLTVWRSGDDMTVSKLVPRADDLNSVLYLSKDDKVWNDALYRSADPTGATRLSGSPHAHMLNRFLGYVNMQRDDNDTPNRSIGTVGSCMVRMGGDELCCLAPYDRNGVVVKTVEDSKNPSFARALASLHIKTHRDATLDFEREIGRGGNDKMHISVCSLLRSHPSRLENLMIECLNATESEREEGVWQRHLEDFAISLSRAVDVKMVAAIEAIRSYLRDVTDCAQLAKNVAELIKRRVKVGGDGAKSDAAVAAGPVPTPAQIDHLNHKLELLRQKIALPERGGDSVGGSTDSPVMKNMRDVVMYLVGALTNLNRLFHLTKKRVEAVSTLKQSTPFFPSMVMTNNDTKNLPSTHYIVGLVTNLQRDVVYVEENIDLIRHSRSVNQ